jgi:hypothetical protein
MSASTGAIHRAAAIHLAVDTVPSDTDAGFNADTTRANADPGSHADTGRAGTDARNDTHTARAPAGSRLPDAALRRTVGVAINRRVSR